MAKKKEYMLFSPVGGTDPISNSNYHDGSLLHICRIYKPKIVILYMSSEVFEQHETPGDDRFRYALNKLAEKQGRTNYWIEDLNIETIKEQFDAVKGSYDTIFAVIRRPELKDVHKMDFFYDEYSKIIANLVDYKKRIQKSNMEFILNISSGTPAMKSSLFTIGAINTYSCKSIQVSTPDKKMNEHDHKNYDVETLWGLNPDNETEFEGLGRCEEVEISNIMLLKYETIIKEQLKNYNYAAAYELSKIEEIAEKTLRYQALLKLAYLRQQLKYPQAIRLDNEHKFGIFKSMDENHREYFEYALISDLKLQKGEFDDFLRSLTPLIAWIFEKILEKSCHINLEDFCDKEEKEDDKIRLRWSEKKLKGTKLDEVLNKSSDKNNQVYGKDVYSSNLVALITNFSSDKALVTLVKNIRKVEQSRNKVAHSLVSLTAEDIKKSTKFRPEEIMDMIKEAMHYAGLDFTGKDKRWKAYDDMNKKIMEVIENR